MKNPENLPAQQKLNQGARVAFALAATIGSALPYATHPHPPSPHPPSGLANELSGAAVPMTIFNPGSTINPPSPDVSTESFIKVGGIPEVVENTFIRNVVFLTNGCSGYTIRQNGDPNGTAVGVVFARHCGLIPSKENSNPSTWSTEYVSGSNGQKYVVQEPIVPQSGTALSGVQPNSAITNVLVPKENNPNSDVAVGIYPGFSAGEVWKSYLNSRATNTELEALKPGKSTIYMGGWPVNQAGNKKSEMIMQQFAMTNVGNGVVTSDTGEIFDAVIAAIPKTEYKVDQAVCSFGNSGAAGFIMENGQPKIIGPLSGFWGLTALHDYISNKVYNNESSPGKNKQYLTRRFPFIDWNRFAAACALSTTNPNQPMLVHLVPSNQYIPGSILPSAEKSAMITEKFVNPNAQRTYFSGEVVVDNQNILTKGGGPDPYSVSINNPMITTGSDGTVYLGYYNPENPGSVSSIAISKTELPTVKFYPNNPNEAPEVDEVSIGPLIYRQRTVKGMQEVAYMRDSSGTALGIWRQTHLDPSPQLPDKQFYYLSIQDNRYQFHLVQLKP
jgi:hypothetical protein